MTGLDLLPTQQRGEGTFDQVDNPGGWIGFSYFPAFAPVSHGGEYKDCCLPTGCHPVSPNEDDSSICTNGGWIFYHVWKKGEDKDVVRKEISEADTPSWLDVQDKLLPRSRQG